MIEVDTCIGNVNDVVKTFLILDNYFEMFP